MADATDLKRQFSLNLVSEFLSSRRQGLSPSTLKFYNGYLHHSIEVIGLDVLGWQIAWFLNSLLCSNGGKHSYYRALRTFYNWLYSRRTRYDLKPEDNPILIVDAPKVEKKVMPSLTSDQVEYLKARAETLRDKCIISLFADSGMRVSELTNIQIDDINWETKTITIWGKGSKQRRAPFTENTGRLLRKWLAESAFDVNIWGMYSRHVQWMLRNLG
ncbi:tyrosine-type recombinase/integrase, partial [Chloroflexota bacterium]